MVTGQPSVVDVLWDYFGVAQAARGRLYREDCEYLVDMLTTAGLLATPERLAQERAAALDEAADALEGAGRVYGYAVAHDLRARAEAEREVR